MRTNPVGVEPDLTFGPSAFSHFANPSSLLDCNVYHHLEVTGTTTLFKVFWAFEVLKQLMPFLHLLRFIHWNKGAWLKQPHKSTYLLFLSRFWLLNFKHLYPGSFKRCRWHVSTFCHSNKKIVTCHHRNLAACRCHHSSSRIHFCTVKRWLPHVPNTQHHTSKIGNDLQRRAEAKRTPWLKNKEKTDEYVGHVQLVPKLPQQSRHNFC